MRLFCALLDPISITKCVFTNMCWCFCFDIIDWIMASKIFGIYLLPKDDRNFYQVNLCLFSNNNCIHAKRCSVYFNLDDFAFLQISATHCLTPEHFQCAALATRFLAISLLPALSRHTLATRASSNSKLHWYHQPHFYTGLTNQLLFTRNLILQETGPILM